MTPRKFKISFDYSSFDYPTERTHNVWGAHAITMEECGLGNTSVSRVEYIGVPVGGPILEVTFTDILYAQVYIHVYLGNDPKVYNTKTMDDIWEYLKLGEFVME